MPGHYPNDGMFPSPSEHRSGIRTGGRKLINRNRFGFGGLRRPYAFKVTFGAAGTVTGTEELPWNCKAVHMQVFQPAAGNTGAIINQLSTEGDSPAIGDNGYPALPLDPVNSNHDAETWTVTNTDKIKWSFTAAGAGDLYVICELEGTDPAHSTDGYPQGALFTS